MVCRYRALGPFGRAAIAMLGATVALVAFAAPIAARAGPTPREPRVAGDTLHVGALGLMPVHGTRTRPAAGRVSADALTYHGGPVMHSSTTYTIYWEPSTCGIAPCTVVPGYNTGVDTYFADAAAGSGTVTNVYSTLDQYYSVKRGIREHIQYAQTFGASYLDTTPFPATNGCPGFRYGTSGVCLSDKQVRDEIAAVMTSQSWPGGKSRALFLMLPSEVDTCFSANICAFTQFCAYHSAFTSPSGRPIIYADIPYAGITAACSSGKVPPNGGELDATLNAASHEHREMTNDPFGNGWWNDLSGQEGSDRCAYRFGPDLGNGGPNDGAYNQVINGHDYLVQMEWSNRSAACLQRGR